VSAEKNLNHEHSALLRKWKGFSFRAYALIHIIVSTVRFNLIIGSAMEPAAYRAANLI